jgi:lipoic acid synthetase
MVASCGAEVIGHNIEVVERLYPIIKRDADYKRSIGVLKSLSKYGKNVIIKSGIMLGLGEGKEEVTKTLYDMREAGVEWVTLGQYLRPNKSCVEVKEYISEEKFRDYGEFARRLGFSIVQSGTYVRSSYNSAELYFSFNLRRAL